MENSNVKLPEGIIILPCYGNNMAIIEHGNKMFFWTATLFVFFGLCSQGFIVDPADTVNQHNWVWPGGITWPILEEAQIEGNFVVWKLYQNIILH